MLKHKKGRLHYHITPWVAMVIIAALAALVAIWLWTKANDSWVYTNDPTRYPKLRQSFSKVITAVGTVGWKSYRDDGYGFMLRYPAKYQKTVGSIVGSVLGTTKAPVFGTSVGPLVFVKVEQTALKNKARAKFNFYWESNDCIKKSVNTGLDIKLVFCEIEGEAINYGLVRGEEFDIFVDGYTAGYDKELLNTYGLPGKSVTPEEMLTILSTFTFLPQATTGTLYGKATIVCPGTLCSSSPEDYLSREIIVFKSDGTTEVARSYLKSDGTYTQKLPAGEYILDMSSSFVGSSQELPKKITITAGQTTTFNFNIDTSR